MLGYRLYCLDEQAGIRSREDFGAWDDQAAITVAVDLLGAAPGELWQSKRMVAMIRKDGLIRPFPLKVHLSGKLLPRSEKERPASGV